MLSIWYLFLISCSNDEKQITEIIEEESYLQIDDICGVWVSPNNKLHYIAIYPSGRYTYCFNNSAIGSGTYSLGKNTLTLNDGYSYESYKFDLTRDGNNLNLNGAVNYINSNLVHISITYRLSNEELSPSIEGKKLHTNGGLNAKYDNLDQILRFESEYILKYEYTGTSKKTGQRKTISEHTWYYAYRKPYTYCYKLNEEKDGLEIYDFPFTYIQDWGTLDIRLDDFRIQ